MAHIPNISSPKTAQPSNNNEQSPKETPIRNSSSMPIPAAKIKQERFEANDSQANVPKVNPIKRIISTKDAVANARKTENGYECPKCKSCLPDTESLKIHIKSVHVKSKKLPCKYCNFETTSRSLLNKHMSEAHEQATGEPEIDPKLACLTCPRCTFTSPNKIELINHISFSHKDFHETMSSKNDTELPLF